jgi:hypothetical protein
MRFTYEILQRIIHALTERMGPDPSCPLCHHNNWTVSDGPVFLSVEEKARRVPPSGGRSLPCVPITCIHCGNTHLVNLVTLGLGDLLLQGEGEEAGSLKAEEASAKR